jgi:hypothetical protein
MSLKNTSVKRLQRGTKYDAGKIRLNLIEPSFINGLGSVMTFGATKYGSNNWKNGIPTSQLYASLQRHLTSFYEGNLVDSESGLDHLYHSAANIMMMIWMRKFNPKFEDINIGKKMVIDYSCIYYDNNIKIGELYGDNGGYKIQPRIFGYLYKHSLDANLLKSVGMPYHGIKTFTYCDQKYMCGDCRKQTDCVEQVVKLGILKENNIDVIVDTDERVIEYIHGQKNNNILCYLMSTPYNIWAKHLDNLRINNLDEIKLYDAKDSEKDSCREQETALDLSKISKD